MNGHAEIIEKVVCMQGFEGRERGGLSRASHIMYDAMRCDAMRSFRSPVARWILEIEDHRDLARSWEIRILTAWMVDEEYGRGRVAAGWLHCILHLSEPGDGEFF